MLCELFDGAGPLATGLGRHRMSEALSAVLTFGAPMQQSAAQASAQSLVDARQGMLDLHGRIAGGELTEEPFLRGRALAERLEYPTEVIDNLPDRLVERFIGLANPFSLGRAQPGETVLDVGCGAGLDTAVARHDVGADGTVVGLDATGPMVVLANHLAGHHNRRPRFARSFAEHLPIASGRVDLVTANGVLMMCDRAAALGDFFRVLKPGGRVQFADILYEDAHTPSLVAEWHSIWSKPPTQRRWRALLEGAGFVDIEFGPVSQPHRQPPQGQAATRPIRAVKPT
ncbi:MAG: methyltransferase domain-containing protein [Actinomycetia bacterium]|nr:methyltransferase domain-containing protein [Actinomycetes bacterium]